MSGRAEAAVPLADWLSLAAAVLFAGFGLFTIRSAETLILRLAALGMPAWPAYAAAVLEILAAVFGRRWLASLANSGGDGPREVMR